VEYVSPLSINLFLVNNWRENFGYFIVLKVRFFNSTEHIMNYVRARDYDTSARPGICFGISHIASGPASHEFKMHFDDQESEEMYNLASQLFPSVDPYQTRVKQDAYVRYWREGYSFMQNWCANHLLRVYTNKSDARIISMTAPMRSEDQISDRFQILLQNLFPLCIVLVYIIPILRVSS
jgi:hypothetical protein